MTPWWGVIVAWIPSMMYNYMHQGGTPLEQLLVFIAGCLAWTWFEYALHRFLFHMEDQPYFMRHPKFYAVHFMVHGIHHAFPSDAYRLVFPPFLGHIVYFSIFYYPLRAVMPEAYFYSFLLGTQFAYLIYDMIHYFFHHANPADGTYLKAMKVYHM